MSALGLIGISLLATLWFRRAPFVFVGWFWYLGTLLPASGLVVQMAWPDHADRFAYFPLVGIYIALFFSLDRVTRSAPRLRLTATSISSMVVLVLAIATSRQVEIWQDSLSLWSHNISVTRPACVSQLRTI